MRQFKNPCVICEKYIKAVRCDEAEECPVGQMKKENARLKRKLKQDGKWELEWEDSERLERRRQGIF